MKILSIDWDYFFPNSTNYDWGAHESQMLFYEIVWYSRVSAMNLVTKANVLEEYIPSIPENFWDLVTNQPKIIVADSHCAIWDLLDKSTIYNLDAHHDCGYQKKDHIDCANWGQWGISTGQIKKFHLYYPSWRKKDGEGKSLAKPTKTNYKLPKPQKFDLIFVCRSSCWTPPWYDAAFDEFLEESELEIEKTDDLVRSQRNISLSQAMGLREQFEAAYKRIVAG